MAPYLKKYRWWAFGIGVSILVREGALLLEPQIFRWIVDLFQQFGAGQVAVEALRAESSRVIWSFVGVQLMVLVGFIAFFTFMNQFMVRVMRDATIDFVQHVLHLSFGFHSNRRTGTLSKEFSRGISGMENLMDAILFNFFPMIVRLVSVIAIFAFLDWRLGLVLLVVVVLFAIFAAIIGIRLQNLREKSNDAEDVGTGRALDALMNAELVKYYQQEEYESDAFTATRNLWKQQKLREWDSWTIVGSGQTILMGLGMIGVLLILVTSLESGVSRPADVVLITGYLAIVAQILWDFQWNIRRFLEGTTDTGKFMAYFDVEQEIVDAPNAPRLEPTHGEIQFENIVFSYTEDRKILRGLTLNIPAKTSVALVGPSGVGKSTIMKLLYRFYDAQEGRIVIDGQDITEVTQRSLREALSIVPQETALFNENIRYNIAYGAKDATQEDIERVAKLAHIHDFVISLPKGYETMVGERGIKLSGGEKQRISIARALLRDTPIVILDEPTSSLDSQSEQEIQAALENLMKERTVLIIAHRLSTIMTSDQIAVIQDGHVSELGKHEDLIAQNGLYQHLWNLQAGGYIPDVESDTLEKNVGEETRTVLNEE